MRNDGADANRPVYFESVDCLVASTGMATSANLRPTGSPLKKSGR